MSRLDCDAVHDAAPELVLGTLDGAERARLLTHVGDCARCREEIAALADTVNDMALLAPALAPSVGFTDRVLARAPLDGLRGQDDADRPVQSTDAPSFTAAGPFPIELRSTSGHAPHRRRRFAAAVLAAAAVIVLGVGLVVRRGADSAGSVAFAAMVAPDGAVMGSVTSAPDGSLSVAVDYPTNWRDYRFEVVRTDGSVATLGPMTLHDGAWRWEGDVPDPATVDRVRIVRPNGVVTCWGRLPG